MTGKVFETFYETCVVYTHTYICVCVCDRVAYMYAYMYVCRLQQTSRNRLWGGYDQQAP